MNPHLWLAFLITATAMAFVPGPAVLYVAGQGVRHGARKAVAANLGILSGNAVWFAASALGLATLIALAAPVFIVIKWLGVVYLAWLGLCAWRDALRGPRARRPEAAADVPSPAQRERGDRSLREWWVRARSDRASVRMWRQGVLLQLANPKAILFFTALLPQFIDPAHAIAPQVFLLAVTSIVSEFFVLAAYAWLAARGGALLLARPRLARASDAAAGTCLIGAGIGLALAHPTR
jgi:threonine/homoserine/homoserine lactone efflux protein